MPEVDKHRRDITHVLHEVPFFLREWNTSEDLGVVKELLKR
jgi:hypothetical protein